MDGLLAALLPVLPDLTIGTLLFAFTIWRERAHSGEAKRWSDERVALLAEKRDAVKEVRDQHREDDERRDKRISALIAENEQLERQLDEQRRARRAAEDALTGGSPTVQMPRHRYRDEGTAS